MFRFSIRELMLVTMVAAMAVGWWVDRRMLAARLDQFDERLAPFEEEFQTIVSFREQIGKNAETVHKEQMESVLRDSLPPPEVELPDSQAEVTASASSR